MTLEYDTDSEINTLVPEGNEASTKFRRLEAKYGREKALSLIEAEGYSITGFGNDQFKKNRRDLGFTPEKIARNLAWKENNTPPKGPKKHGGRKKE